MKCPIPVRASEAGPVAGAGARPDAVQRFVEGQRRTPAFRTEASGVLKDTYLRSERLQAAVEKQQAALSSGAPCEEVARALKQADFPMPPASATPQQ